MALSRTESVSRAQWHVLRIAALSLGLLFQTGAFAFTLNVVNPDGTPIAGGFRWTLEEDTSYRQPLNQWITPGAPGSEAVHSFNFYKSHMPVVGSGAVDAASVEVAAPDAAKHYFVSVLARDAEYQMSARPVPPGAASVTVVLYRQPVPTAQVYVIAFHDNNPINNVLDQAQENGLGGFTVKIDDTLDVVKHDAFGNMLGTVYRRNADGSPVLDGDGNPIVQCPGTGVIRTVTQADINAGGCRNPYNLSVGEALIKNIHPGKYGVRVTPPTGTNWQQTATIEGTKTVDAWIKANEPQYFAEFGAGVWHAEFGFVQPFNTLPAGGGGSISGQIVNMHMSRPPALQFSSGHPLDGCWVGLNESLAGGLAGRGLFAAPCGDEATFSIPNVPAGTYQLVMWDNDLVNIFGFHTVVVPAGGAVDLGQVPVFRWFGTHDHYVFYDSNNNGIRDIDPATGQFEPGIPEQVVNLRYRDGSMYLTAPTDLDGYVPFDTVFPFFFWQVAEVDFLRFKATGVTVTVDAGGAVPTEAANPLGRGKLNPQIQEGGAQQRTESGPVLTQAFQSFLGTTNVFEWGKRAYDAGENGGISGIVRYATTRAENDPRFAAADDWEPGIPRVQVSLYRDSNGDNQIDDVNGEAGIQLADVDNYPLDNFPGPEDLDRNGNGQFDAGDAVNVVHTDSWDDSVPTGCPPGNAPNAASDIFYQGGKCYDGPRNYNQVRPGVFDGGYAFNDYHPNGMTASSTAVALTSGLYIVESATPPGYAHQTEESKNVDFGDRYVPSPMMLPPICVGDKRTVPAQLTLFPGVDAPFAGQSRPYCDRKQVLLADRQNGAADFYLYTEAPITGHIQGFVLNDLANEFDVNAPNFAEKQAMPFIPISIRDYTGREINRVYTDEYGSYNGLVPGTFAGNRPSPTGISQSMHQVCVNDPGPIPAPTAADPNRKVTDPNFNRQYTQFCYTMNFLAGRTTFLDTPVMPIAAFANLGLSPADSEFPDGTPMIYSVDNASSTIGGPYVPTGAANRTLTIVSAGSVQVPNPAFTIEGTQPRTIARDFGFGTTPGQVRIGNTLLTVAPGNWTDGSITATVPASAATGQLTVTRGDNSRSSIMGVTVTVGTTQVVNVAQGGSIQAAIDAAPANALVLVPPGQYEEMLIMYKPVRLQGWGAGSTVINATLSPTERTQQWRRKMAQLITANQVTLLPGQTNPLNNIEGFLGSEAAPIFVIARQNGPTSFNGQRRARIDGFTISGSNGSGGIAVNSYANFLTVSNNRVVNNQGIYGGGIRIGQPLTTGARNDNVAIHHNQVCENGTLQTPGGGIALYAGTNNYSVTQNWVCANFAQGNGAGIAHYGLSEEGRIANNWVLFNQTFEQTAGVAGAGGGILVAGEAPAAANGLSPGAGTVTVEANLIQGNNAGTGDGAGIAALRVNGADVNAARTNPNRWHALNIFDNIIVNNVTGVAGGGIALQDTLRARILHNTIAHNDSTATGFAAFLASPTCNATANQSCPQPAGVISRANTGALQAVIAATPRSCLDPVLTPGHWCAFSQPQFANNIVWQNRSFYYVQAPVAGNPGSQPVGQLLPDANTPVFNDLAVLGVAGQLAPRNSVLTSTAGYHPSNTSGDPLFVTPYFNGDRALSIIQPEFTTQLTVAPALDEGGNFIDVRYGPLALTGNYHLQAGSAAASRGSIAYDLLYWSALDDDYDSAARSLTCLTPDAGADELPGCMSVAVAGLAGNLTTTANNAIVIGVNSLAASTHSTGLHSAIGVRTPTVGGGTVAMTPDGMDLLYVPATNWTGKDSFVAVLSDGTNLYPASATVTVDAAPVTDAAAPTMSSDADGADTTTVAAPAITASVMAARGGGLAVGNAQPEAVSEPVSVVARAEPAKMPIEPANQAPVARNDELVLREFDKKTGAWVFGGSDVLDNDSDTEGDTLTTELVKDVKEGSVKLGADGRFQFTPPKSGLPKGELTFTYRVSDGVHKSETATVTFTLDRKLAAPSKSTAPAKAEIKPKSGVPAREAAAPMRTSRLAKP